MSVYQQRHYEDVANLLEYQRGLDYGPSATDALDELSNNFADLFAKDNPPTCRLLDGHHGDCANTVGGFDKQRFLTACGLEEK